MGFFGGGGNYSDSSESDSDAEDEREAAVAPTPRAGDEEGRSAKEKEGTQPKGEDDGDPPERDIADADALLPRALAMGSVAFWHPPATSLRWKGRWCQD